MSKIGDTWTYDERPEEEARIMRIRNAPFCRTVLIARDRVERPRLPMHPVELRWVKEDFNGISRHPAFGVLTQRELEALVEAIMPNVDTRGAR